MERKLRYRLGLDLGTTSIGWSILRLSSENAPTAVVRMGVRIFSDGRNPKDRTSLAVRRRLARQARRRRDRLLKRKAQLVAALTRHGFFPDDSAERKRLVSMDPYTLRRRGLYEPLSGPEFGRALFHINQRRGFKSNRKTDRGQAESGLLKTSIKQLRERIEAEGCQTLGEWLAVRHKARLSVRARLRGQTKKEQSYDFYADRSMAEEEFDKLWAAQVSFSPDQFTDAARVELKDILLFQRPLKPVRPGRCTLLPDEDRAPLALPSYQQFRVLQELNNLRLVAPDLTEATLTLDQRNILVTALERGDLTFTKIRKLLKLGGIRFNLEDARRDRLKGNATSKILSHKKKGFGDRWHSFSTTEQDAIVEHLLDEPSPSALIGWLVDSIGVAEELAETIGDLNLPDGYGRLSKAALARVVPELREDIVDFSEAVRRAGFDSHSALTSIEQSGELLDSLPYYGEILQRHVGFGTGNVADSAEVRYGRIGNPTVHIALNELRKVVNGLLEQYGRPAEVVIEVTRDLKLGEKARREIERTQADNQKRNRRLLEEACKVLGELPDNLRAGKRRQIVQKMRLWEELDKDCVLNRCCPFTGERIGLTKLLSNEVEIEHVLPFSRTLDDSLNNKTVALRRANRIKANKTPWEAFGSGDIEGYDPAAMLERAARMPRAKAKRFAPDGYEQWLRDDAGFLARALNDTAYISRLAREYLSSICLPNTVRTIPGRLTAMLRGKFGLNQLISSNSWKSRDDHRHHAVDAVVVGITDQGLLQRFATANARAQELGLQKLVDEMPLPWPTFREHVERALKSIVVSYRPDHGYQGAMHEDTAWGVKPDGQATQKQRPDPAGPRVKKTATRKLVEVRGDPQRHGFDASGNPRAYKGYVGGNNYCIEIVRNAKGDWRGKVVSTYEAYQVIRRHGAERGLRKLRGQKESLSGEPLVMRLMINDMLRLSLDGRPRIMRVVKIRSNGVITLCNHNEANADARDRNSADPFSFTNKSAGPLRLANARQITVSPTGVVKVKRQ